MTISRRNFLGRAAIAPVAAVGVMDQVASKAAMSRLAPQAAYNPTRAGQDVAYPSPEADALRAARRFLRKMDRKSDIESLVYLDAMQSWSASTKVRAMREWREQVRADRKPFEKILGWEHDDE